jgi:hypothetical protein
VSLVKEWESICLGKHCLAREAKQPSIQKTSAYMAAGTKKLNNTPNKKFMGV